MFLSLPVYPYYSGRFFWLPTQRMHMILGNPSKFPYMCRELFEATQNWVFFNDHCYRGIFHGGIRPGGSDLNIACSCLTLCWG